MSYINNECEKYAHSLQLQYLPDKGISVIAKDYLSENMTTISIPTRYIISSCNYIFKIINGIDDEF